MDLIFIIGFIIWSFISTTFGKAQIIRPYSFSYSVADPKSGNFQGHEQHLDENGSTSGSYYHLAPDGMWHKTTFSDEGYGYTAGTQHMDPNSPFKGSSVSVYHYTGPQAKSFSKGLIGQSVISGVRNLSPHDSKVTSEERTNDRISYETRQRSISKIQRDNLLPSKNLGPYDGDEKEITIEGESEKSIEEGNVDEMPNKPTAIKNSEITFQKETRDQSEQSNSSESYSMSDSFNQSRPLIKKFIAEKDHQFSPPNEYEDYDETLPTLNESKEETDLSYPLYDYVSSSEELTNQSEEELSTPIFDTEIEELPEITEMKHSFLDLGSLNQRIRELYSHGKPLLKNVNNIPPLAVDYEQSSEKFEAALEYFSELKPKNMPPISQKNKVQTEGSSSLEVPSPDFVSSTIPLESHEEVHTLPYLTSPLIFPIRPKISMEQLQQQQQHQELDSIDNDQFNSQEENTNDNTDFLYYYDQNPPEGENHKKIFKSESSTDSSDESATSDKDGYEGDSLGAVLLQLSNYGSYEPSTRLMPMDESNSSTSNPIFENNAVFISQNFLNHAYNENQPLSSIFNPNDKKNDKFKSSILQLIKDGSENGLLGKTESDISNANNNEFVDSTDPNDSNGNDGDSSSEIVHSEPNLSAIVDRKRENELNYLEQELIKLTPPNILPIVIILNPSNVLSNEEIEDTLKKVNINGSSILNPEFGVKIPSQKKFSDLNLIKANSDQPNVATEIKFPMELASFANQSDEVTKIIQSENFNNPAFDAFHELKEHNMQNPSPHSTSVRNAINSIPGKEQLTVNLESDSTEESYDNLKVKIIKNEDSGSIGEPTDASIFHSVIPDDARNPTPVNKFSSYKEGDNDSLEDDSLYEVSTNKEITSQGIDIQKLDSPKQIRNKFPSLDTKSKDGKVLSILINNEVPKIVTANNLKVMTETSQLEFSDSNYRQSKNNTNSLVTTTAELRSSEEYDEDEEKTEVKTKKSNERVERIRLLESYKKRVAEILVPQILKTVSDMIPSIVNNTLPMIVSDGGGSHEKNKSKQQVENVFNANSSHPSLQQLELNAPKETIIIAEVEQSNNESKQSQIKLSDEDEKLLLIQDNYSKVSNKKPFIRLQEINNSSFKDSALVDSKNESKLNFSEEVSSISSTDDVAQNEKLPEVHITSSPGYPKAQNTLFQTQITQILNRLRGKPLSEQLDQESLPVTSLTLSQNPKDISTISILVDDSNDFNNKENAIKYITEELKKTIHPTLVSANFYSIPLAMKSQILQSDIRKGPKLAIHGRETKIRRAQLQSIINQQVNPTGESKERYEISGKRRKTHNYDTRTRLQLPRRGIRKSSPIIKWSEIVPSKTSASLEPNPANNFPISPTITYSDQLLNSISQSSFEKVNSESLNPESITLDNNEEDYLVNQSKKNSSTTPNETKRTRTDLPPKQFIPVRRKSNKNLLANKINEALRKEVPLGKREVGLSNINTNTENTSQISNINSENNRSSDAATPTDSRGLAREFLESENLNSTNIKIENNPSIPTPSANSSSKNESAGKLLRWQNVNSLRIRNNGSKTLPNKRFLTIVDLQKAKNDNSVTQLRPFIQIPRKLVNKMASAKSFGFYRNPNPVELKPIKMDDQMTTTKLDAPKVTKPGMNSTTVDVQSRPFRYFSLISSNNGPRVREGSDKIHKRRRPTRRRKNKSSKNSRQFRYTKNEKTKDEKLEILSEAEIHKDDITANESSSLSIQLTMPDIEIQNNFITNQTLEITNVDNFKEVSTFATQNSSLKETPESYVKFKEEKLENVATNVENAILSLNATESDLLNENSTESNEQQVTTTPITIRNNPTNNNTLVGIEESPLLTSDIINVSKSLSNSDSSSNAQDSNSVGESNKNNVQLLNANGTDLILNSEFVVDSSVNVTITTVGTNSTSRINNIKI